MSTIYSIKAKRIKGEKHSIKCKFRKKNGYLLTYREFLNLLKNQDKKFLEDFTGLLNQESEHFDDGYFWECPPITYNTLDQPFEFVLVKSKELAEINQDFTSFNEHINGLTVPVTSFPNKGNDATLVVPNINKKDDGSLLDYKNINQFTKNAPPEQQKAFWQLVANKMLKDLESDKDKPKWLSTHGLGVYYLHVRIDSQPKYYSHRSYKEFKKKKQEEAKFNPPKEEPRQEKSNETKEVNSLTPDDSKKTLLSKNDANSNKLTNKEKILRNLDKITFDQVGHLANAKLLKDDEIIGKAEAYRIKIDGEEIKLLDFERAEQKKDYLEIRKNFVDNIKKNISDWKIKKAKRGLDILENQKNGVIVGKIIFSKLYENGEQDWAEIETSIKTSENNEKSSFTSENDKQNKNEFPWKIAFPLGAAIILLLGVIIFVFWRKNPKKKKKIVYRLELIL